MDMIFLIFMLYISSAYFNCMEFVLGDKEVSPIKFKIVVLLPIINTIYAFWLLVKKLG